MNEKKIGKKTIIIGAVALVVAAAIAIGLLLGGKTDKEETVKEPSSSGVLVNKGDNNTTSEEIIVEENNENTKEDSNQKVKKDTYTITFYDDNGKTVLQTSEVKAGSTPKYDGALPTKQESVSHTFTFAGWDKEIATATEDTSYKATYKATEKRKYTVTFYDSDQQTVISKKVVYEGQMPTYNGETPTKDETESTTYEFSGWDKKFNFITADTNYYAKYTATEKPQYTAIFYDDDGTVLQKAKKFYEGQEPIFYDNVKAKKGRDDHYTYVFDHWDPKPMKMYVDQNFVAVYRKVSEENKDIVINSSELNEFGYLDYDRKVINVFPSADSNTTIKVSGMVYKTTTTLKIPANFIGKEKTGHDIIPSDAKDSDKYYVIERTKKEITKGTATGYDFGDWFIASRETGTVEVDRFYWNDILPFQKYTTVGIADNTFYNNDNLEQITIPNTVKRIGNYAFCDCNYLTRILFEGTKAEWNAIEKGIGWDKYTGDYAVQCTDGDIKKGENIGGVAIFSNGTTLNWTDLMKAENGQKYGYLASEISDTRIGDRAFEPSSERQPTSGATLTDLVLPNTITSIGDLAFNNSNLKSILLSENLEQIGDYAFYNCDKLLSIVIPKNVHKIGTGNYNHNPFLGCSYLSSIVVSEGNDVYSSFDNSNAIINKVTNEVIAGCKNTVIPAKEEDKVFSIGPSSLAGVINGDIVIPNKITDIKEYAFYEDNIKIVDLPTDLVNIGDYAFNSCKGVERIDMYDKVKTIGQDAFTNINSLEGNVTLRFHGTRDDWNKINKNSQSIGQNITIICNDTEKTKYAEFTDRQLLSWNEILDLTKGNLYGYDASKLTNNEIGDDAFASCTKLRAISIPNEITSIGKRAFVENTNLNSVVIPSGVTSIKDSTFANCSKLREITIPSTITSFERYAFSNCESLSVINFGGTVSQFNAITKASSWDNNTGKYTVHCLDGNITKADESPVLTLIRNLLGISSKAPENGVKNESINVVTPETNILNEKTNNNIEEIIQKNEEIFESSKTNNELDTSSSGSSKESLVSTSNKDGFSVNSNNKTLAGYDEKEPKLVINSSIIGNGENGTEIGERYSVKTISQKAFENCENLTEVVIPDGIETIEKDAFRGCTKLAKITIPTSVKSIGDDVFYKCSKLTNIVFNGTTSEWNGISKWKNWNSGTVAYTVYCTDGSISK